MPDVRQMVTDPRFRALSEDRKRKVLEAAGADPGFIDSLLQMQTTPAAAAPAPGPLHPEAELKPAQDPRDMSPLQQLRDSLAWLSSEMRIKEEGRAEAKAAGIGQTPTTKEEILAALAPAIPVSLGAAPVVGALGMGVAMGGAETGRRGGTALGEAITPGGGTALGEAGEIAGLIAGGKVMHAGVRQAPKPSNLRPMSDANRSLYRATGNRPPPGSTTMSEEEIGQLLAAIDAAKAARAVPKAGPSIDVKPTTATSTPAGGGAPPATPPAPSGGIGGVVDVVKGFAPEARGIGYELAGRKIGSMTGVPGAVLFGGRIGRYLQKVIHGVGSRNANPPAPAAAAPPTPSGDEALIEALMAKLPGSTREQAAAYLAKAEVGPAGVVAPRPRSAPAPAPMSPEAKAEFEAAMSRARARVGEAPPAPAPAPAPAPPVADTAPALPPRELRPPMAVEPPPVEKSVEGTVGKLDEALLRAKQAIGQGPEPIGPTTYESLAASGPGPARPGATAAEQQVAKVADSMRRLREAEKAGTDTSALVAEIRKQLRGKGVIEEAAQSIDSTSTEVASLARAVGMAPPKADADITELLLAVKAAKAATAAVPEVSPPKGPAVAEVPAAAPVALKPRRPEGAVGPYEDMSPAEELDHVVRGTKPAFWSHGPKAEIEALKKTATAAGLPVEVRQVGDTAWISVGKDQPKLKALTDALKFKGADPDTELGLALGYTEADIAGFKAQADPNRRISAKFEGPNGETITVPAGLAKAIGLDDIAKSVGGKSAPKVGPYGGIDDLIKKSIPSKPTGEYVYHITKSSNLPSMAQKGLVPPGGKTGVEVVYFGKNRKIRDYLRRPEAEGDFEYTGPRTVLRRRADPTFRVLDDNQFSTGKATPASDLEAYDPASNTWKPVTASQPTQPTPLKPRRADGSIGPYEDMAPREQLEHVISGDKPAMLHDGTAAQVNKMRVGAEKAKLPYTIEWAEPGARVGEGKYGTIFVAKDQAKLDALVAANKSRDDAAIGKALGYTDADTRAYAEHVKALGPGPQVVTLKPSAAAPKAPLEGKAPIAQAHKVGDRIGDRVVVEVDDKGRPTVMKRAPGVAKPEKETFVPKQLSTKPKVLGFKPGDTPNPNHPEFVKYMEAEGFYRDSAGKWRDPFSSDQARGEWPDNQPKGGANPSAEDPVIGDLKNLWNQFTKGSETLYDSRDSGALRAAVERHHASVESYRDYKIGPLENGKWFVDSGDPNKSVEWVANKTEAKKLADKLSTAPGPRPAGKPANPSVKPVPDDEFDKVVFGDEKASGIVPDRPDGKYAYHITKASNLDAIRRHGIVPRDELLANAGNKDWWGWERLEERMRRVGAGTTSDKMVKMTKPQLVEMVKNASEEFGESPREFLSGRSAWFGEDARIDNLLPDNMRSGPRVVLRRPRKGLEAYEWAEREGDAGQLVTDKRTTPDQLEYYDFVSKSWVPLKPRPPWEGKSPRSNK